jgi:Uma2 family endonuclease
MSTEPVLLGYDDWLALDDERPAQLIEGIFVLTPPPTIRHQRILLRLSQAVAGHVMAHRLGEVLFAPVDVLLRAERPGVVLQPDLLYVSAARRDRVTERHVAGGPDLVVEILSPSTARLDLGYKKAAYAAHGVREYWVVPVDRDRVEVMCLDADGRFAAPRSFEAGEALVSGLFPGWSLPVASLFEA